MADEDTGKFYELVAEIEKLCRQRGELPFAEVERMALAKDKRPSAVLDDLSISEEFEVDLTKGKVIYKG